MILLLQMEKTFSVNMLLSPFGLLQQMRRLYLTLHSLAKPRIPACADFVAVASACPFC